MMHRSTPSTASAAGVARSLPTPELIGEHSLVHQVRALVSRVARTDATVLIDGESGTGKEVAARMIHVASPRAEQPFIAVNCGAIPAELLESEMFGHERGAFTNAVGSRAGLFQLAHRGTIFLDEIGEMSPALQVKLLRVLQEQEVRPVGADRAVRIDVRVIAATNKDLAAEVPAGRFREDLFYRLNVVPVSMPPLRERRSDIPVLVEHFLAQLTRRHGRGPMHLTEDAMVHLWEYGWPGNVRQLENVVERLVILAEGDEIDSALLPASMRNFISHHSIPDVHVSDEGVDLARVVDEFESGLIHKAILRTHGNKQAAARLLGLNRTTLVAKLRRRDEIGGMALACA